MAPNRYWLYDWIDEAGIKSLKSAEQALGNKKLIEALQARAFDYHDCEERPDVTERSILAGTGLDLTGNLGCYAPEWRGKEVDHLLSKGWLYFDQIVVADAATPAIVHHWERMPEEERRRQVLGQVAVALRLRAIGADELVVFSPKPHPSAQKLREQQGDDWLARLSKRLSPGLIESIAEEAEIAFRTQEAGGWNYRMNHPLFLHTQWGRIDPGLIGGDGRSARVAAVLNALEDYAFALLCDVEAARRASLPLGGTNAVHSKMIRGLRPEGSVDECAFEMRMPVLKGVPVREIIAMRRDHADHYDRLRIALRHAVRARLEAGENNSEVVVRDVQADIIEPEINKIRTEMTAAKHLIQKRLARDVVVGGVATVCGFAFGMGAASLVGLLAPTALSSKPLDNYWETQRDVEMRDFYFLWKAEEHAAKS